MKTHTFNGYRYYIEECNGLDGMCDIPEPPGSNEKYQMFILDGNDFRAFASALHESLHASGFNAKDLDGDIDKSKDVARFLWRWLKERRRVNDRIL